MPEQTKTTIRTVYLCDKCGKDGTESNWQAWKVQEFDLVKLQKETE